MKTNYCAKCKGKCCSGESFGITIGEYIRLIPYLKGRLKEKEVSPTTDKQIQCRMWYLQEGGLCPALGQNGCRAPYKLRPAICKAFPYVMPSTSRKGDTIEIHVRLSRTCRHWRKFALTTPKEVEEIFIKYLNERKDLFRLESSGALTRAVEDAAIEVLFKEDTKVT